MASSMKKSRKRHLRSLRRGNTHLCYFSGGPWAGQDARLCMSTGSTLTFRVGKYHGKYVVERGTHLRWENAT